MDKRAKNQIVDSDIARLLLKLRKSRNLTVTELAQRSGVSQAMISKVERGTSSPSATILSRLANALNITLSKLFAELEMQQNSLVLLTDQQQHWIDEETGITRWSLSPAGACPELIKVEIPPMGQLTIPASANEHLSGQTLWMLSGSLDFRVNHQTQHLQAGDCLALTFASEYQMRNPDSGQSCSYIVAFSQKNP
ncbi:helix-turn-helix transcriptional regulator [Escherichia coli]|uniref:Transcriptional regulator n=1 Tax=Escherichia coli TaxID=562 RepID=A0A0B1L769_ECOLX|nr:MULTISPECIES: XRE family transcriptional regulator [Escherichia]EHQ5528004.1 helix-turn-helix transcriptional regulator [Escherichia coli O2]EHY2112155.1 helix-turn-helix transcriptional regulator [Escherichia coli O157]EJT2829805.1 helix-turn-helix transcriptional regulator [Shigella boydii]EKF4355422.1 helix-turn-helix transcriptional regulator [Escherichia coli O136]EKH5945411.1 helix-turn-helix transcriptional regulator [Escherichia coli O103]EKM2495296.1 helix-turn-helix transcription